MPHSSDMSRRRSEANLARAKLHSMLFGSRTGPPGVAVSLRTYAVVEVNHAALETAFVQQFELQADVCGEGPFTTSNHDGRDEQVALVYQPGPEGLGGEVGTADADVALRLRFHPTDRFGVEVLLDPRPRAGDRFQRPGVHDLVGRPPHLCEVLLDGRP